MKCATNHDRVFDKRKIKNSQVLSVVVVGESPNNISVSPDMFRTTAHLRPAVAVAADVQCQQPFSHPHQNHHRRALHVAIAAAVVSCVPAAWYYAAVYRPRERFLSALLSQQRPQRSTPVFATGAEPLTNVSAMAVGTNRVVFYARALSRLCQFAWQSAYIFWLVAKRWVSHRLQFSTAATNAESSLSSSSPPGGAASVTDAGLKEIGAELARVFDSMGGAYVKLGQWCATRSDIFPREVCEALETLYDKAAAHPWADTERALAEANLLSTFESIDPTPVSSGTIAQVYRARLRRECVSQDADPVHVKTRSSAMRNDAPMTASSLESAGCSSPSSLSSSPAADVAPAITSTVRTSTRSAAAVDARDSADAAGAGPCLPPSVNTGATAISNKGAAPRAAAAAAMTSSTSIAAAAPDTGATDAAASCVDVAVKIMHPRIRHVILEDMQALRWGVQIISAIVPGAQYLGLTQAVEEFSALLCSQLNMLREAENLNEFRFNFRMSENTVFPRPFLSLTTPDVLVETFEFGVALNSRHVGELGPSNDFADLGTLAVDMFLKMVFEHNLVHADLHPGNILVRIVNGDGSYSLARTGPRSHSQLVVLDPGLVTSMSERERANFIALFTCVATGDGDLGAKLMLERSPEQDCKDVPQFTHDMKQVFDRVTPRDLNLSNIDMSGIMREILDTMRHHRVRIDMNFASLVATVALGEGLGRRLVRDFNLFEAAMPFLLHVLKSHELHYMISKLQEMYLTDVMR